MAADHAERIAHALTRRLGAVRELAAVAEDAQRYLLERCCDANATRLEVGLSEARQRVADALATGGEAPR